MGRRGFPPAPAAVKLAKGERRPSRVNYLEPELDPPQSVTPPAGLAGAGLHEWKRLAPELLERGVLRAADLTAFEDYCRALSDLRRFEQKARQAGPELSLVKKFAATVIKLRQQCNQLRQQCGLTPASRPTVKVAKGQSPAAASLDRYLRVIPGGQADLKEKAHG